MYDSRDISKIKEKQVDYLAIIPVVSFNGGRYDKTSSQHGPAQIHGEKKFEHAVYSNGQLQERRGSKFHSPELFL